MKLKSIIVAVLFIGAFFTGSALAGNNGSVGESFAHAGWRNGAAEGQRGVPEQESRPESILCQNPLNQMDWSYRAAEGQRGVAQQDSRFGQTRKNDEQLAQRDYGKVPRCALVLDDSLRPPDGA
jgi:hypothetical protein